MIERVRSWLAPRADEMAELVARLVAIDSENPPGRELRRCAEVLHDAMTRLGLAPEIVEIADKGELADPCLVRGSVGSGTRTLYFHGHFDVVPAQDRAQFTAVRRDGRLVGRGTADMKGGVVSMLYGAAAAAQLGGLDGRIVLNLVCDEETGSVVGAGHLRAGGLIDPTAVAMVTAEPSGGSIWHAARGAISLLVTVRGREAHVGQANRGVNAFTTMTTVARAVEGYARAMADRHTRFPTDAGDAPGTMVVVGGMSGSGTGFNVVPGSAYFTVDGRFNPEEDLDVELARLRAVIAEAAPDAEVTVTQWQPPASTPETHPAAVALAETVRDVDGAVPRFALCAGILETRWYAQLGIPAFGYGPGRLDVSHGPHEYVTEAALQRCAAVYAAYSARMLS
jgi:acetylornithine deacetylase/succinyl-diaminopimelate desuccinylase-like protein